MPHIVDGYAAWRIKKIVAILQAELTELDGNEIHILWNVFRETSCKVVAACVAIVFSSVSTDTHPSFALTGGRESSIHEFVSRMRILARQVIKDPSM